MCRRCPSVEGKGRLLVRPFPPIIYVPDVERPPATGVDVDPEPPARHDTVTQGSLRRHTGAPREFRREVCLLTTSSMQAIQAEPPRVRVRYISIRHHTCIRCVGCLLLGSSRGFKQEAKVPAGKSLCSACLPARDVRITNTVSFKKKKELQTPYGEAQIISAMASV